MTTATMPGGRTDRVTDPVAAFLATLDTSDADLRAWRRAHRAARRTRNAERKAER